jgi:peptide/nickel transport system permease protein
MARTGVIPAIPRPAGPPDVQGDPLARRAVTSRQRYAWWKSVWGVVTYNRLSMIGFFILAAFVLVGIIGPYLAPYDPTLMGVGAGAEAPSSHHWLGTTQTGQDVWSQLLVGTRTSLMVGFGVGLLSTVIAVLVGSIAGYLGGWVDDVLTLLMNVFLTIPNLPLMIVAASYAAAFNVKGIGVIVAVLTLTGWAWGARVKRSQIMSLRNKDFVVASRVIGENWFRIMTVEILPNMISLIASTFIFGVIFAVLAEAGLEFLGLGDLNSTTWGTMLYWSQNGSALLLGMWWWFIPPGLAIGLFAASLTLIQYVLDEMTNPRLRAQRQRKGGGVVPQMTTTAPHDTARTTGTEDIVPEGAPRGTVA